jgi:antitoxin component YwqK of YwqJK toxin-antitoxin module
MYCPAITLLNKKCNIEIKHSEKYCQTHKKLSEYSSVDSDNFNEKTFILDRSAPDLTTYIIESNVQYSYYPSGNVKTKCIYNGKYSQKLTYLENGNLCSLGNYIFDITHKMHGYQYRYYYNGQIDYKEHYVNGISEGEQLSWHPNGKMMGILNMKNGLNHGMQYNWFDNGNTYFIYNYVNGEKVGLQQTYNYFGELEVEELCL